MESPTTKQSLGATMTQAGFGKAFDINSLLPKSESKLNQSEFNMLAQVEEDSLRPVYPAFQDLSHAVSGLDTKISGIVKRQNEDFLQGYRDEMINIQRELMEMRKKYEDFIARNNGAEQLEQMRKELNLQKVEVLKLDQVISTKNKEIKALKKNITFLEEERTFLNEYIATSVRKNKLISIERHTKPPNVPQIRTPAGRANSEMRSNRVEKIKTPPAESSFQEDRNGIFKLSNIMSEDYEQDLSNVKFETGIEKLDEFLNETKMRDFGDKFRILKDFEAFAKGQAIQMEKKLHDAKKKILKEKTKIDGFLNSRLIARSELAEIFEDCVNKCKQTIEKRRLDGLKLGREGSEFAEKKAIETMRGVKIEYKDFLTQDKNQLLELFLFDDTVLNVIKYMISGGQGLNKKSNGKNSPRLNQSVDQEQQPESILGVSELNDMSMDSRTGRARSKNSSQPFRRNLLQPTPLSQTRRLDTKRDGAGGEGEQQGQERKVTMMKMEQLLGSTPVAGNGQVRMREIVKNYNI